MHKFASLDAICKDRYGVDAVTAPYIAVLWSRDALAHRHGAELADRELAAVNRRRKRLGQVCTTFGAGA